ncbi:hypothetical protein [Terrisporobacter othiniensis]|uniref:hypothetical protein n=1 Tax=Terrisporobacter othiniensis TaxID=1577792 RepID=UPI00126A2AEC|nr:hypothetical protein [Terrisporobacter othiniensis]
MSSNYLISSGCQFRETLSETSKDTANNEYMTNSNMNVINFDSYKEFYINKLNLPIIYDSRNTPQKRGIKSNDALFINNDEIYFIEFKNGSINDSNNGPFSLHTKLYDSLLILLDTIDENISFSRKNIKYILVFNETKKHKAKSFRSNSLNAISSRLADLSNKEIIHFDLHKFKDIYLNEVHTYTKSQFERNFVRRFQNIDMFNQLAVEV